MPKLSSADYDQSDDTDRKQIKASNIDADGIEISFPEDLELRENEGQYGKYFSVDFEHGGEPSFMNFSSKTLKRLIENNIDTLAGKTVTLYAEGTGFDRRYYIDF